MNDRVAVCYVKWLEFLSFLLGWWKVRAKSSAWIGSVVACAFNFAMGRHCGRVIMVEAIIVNNKVNNKNVSDSKADVNENRQRHVIVSNSNL